MRDFLEQLRNQGGLIEEELSPKEIPGQIKANPTAAFLFTIPGSKFRIASGYCATREKIALSLGIKTGQLLGKMAESHLKEGKIKKVKRAPFLNNTAELSELPLPILYSGMAPYLTSSIVAAVDKEYGPNISFHRMAPLGDGRLVARICERHTKYYLERAKELPIAIVMGVHPSVNIAAATTVPLGKNEYEIANQLHPLELTDVGGIPVPASSEIVITGRLTQELASEGPFVDLTGTYDFKRRQPIIEVDKVYHRDSPILHMIVPALPEHALLMGMPREPAILNAVNTVAACKDVTLTSGGCSWLHGAVSITKKSDAEVSKVIKAAFGAHPSMKHLYVVDDDIDIHDPQQLEWAFATRCQGKVKVFTEKGSSLDPSANPKTMMTTKISFDCTIPQDKKRKDFLRA